jgi:anti-sigma factor RsiW
MTCQDVHNLLHAYADHELDLVHTMDIEQHLQSCPPCASAASQLHDLSAALRTRLPYHQAPRDLRHRLTRSASPSRPSFAFQWFRVPPRLPSWPQALAAILVLAIALGLLLLALPARSHPLLAQEITASHIRSLMANHLTDIASTDQHTVKPWFDGKIDFAPAVRDLADHGFPLVGGRLDYLQHRPVAALVYRYRQHPINLFIWPETADSASPTAETRNGYHLIHWTQDGMTFWAVTDASPESLQTFADALRHPSP